MGRRRNNEFFSSLRGNQEAYSYYLMRFAELSMSMFEWRNLPKTVDPRYLEMALFEESQAVYFNDEFIGDLCLSVVFQGDFNPYGYPNRRMARSRYSSYHKWLKPSDSVIIYNNLMRTNTFPTVKYFAKRLCDLDRTIDVNARTQKTPILLLTPENQKLTMEQVYKEYDGNAPIIKAYQGLFDENAFKVLKTDAPYVGDRIYQLKVNIFNECLTYLGIPNSIVNKKERQIKDEVQRDLGGTLASRYSRLVSRQRAVELINDMFKTEIEVVYRDEEAVQEAVQKEQDRLQQATTLALPGGDEDE